MSGEDMYYIGMDVGYGDVKVLVGTELEILAKYKFPSVVAPVIISDHFVDSRAIKLEDKSYYVGTDALAMESIHQYSIDEYKHLEAFTPVFIQKVINALPDKNRPIKIIVLGLSVAQIKFSANYHLKVREYLDSIGLASTEIKILPQGAGVKIAYDKYADTFPVPSTIMSKSSTYLICEIGFNTIDILYVIDGVVSPNRIKGVENMGLTVLAKMLSNVVKELYPNLQLSIKDLKVVLETGTIRIRGVTVDVRDKIVELKSSYLKMVESMMESEYGRILDRVDFMLIGGGGAHYFKDIVSAFYRTTGPESEYYNAIGYYTKAVE